MKNPLLCFLDQPDRARPLVLALVGPNGSGKSSVANLLRLTNVRAGDTRFAGRLAIDEANDEILLPMVNPDEIAKAIRRNSPELDWDVCNMRASRDAGRIREMLANARFDFGFETVGSHQSKVEFLEQLKHAGYIIGILFISTNNPKINVDRVKERHRNGGHDVPPEKVITRYERTMSLLPDYIRVADFLAAYDNSEDHERGDGESPKLLLVKRGEDIAITKQGRQSSWLMKHADRIITQ